MQELEEVLDMIFQMPEGEKVMPAVDKMVALVKLQPAVVEVVSASQKLAERFVELEKALREIGVGEEQAVEIVLSISSLPQLEYLKYRELLAKKEKEEVAVEVEEKEVEGDGQPDEGSD